MPTGHGFCGLMLGSSVYLALGISACGSVDDDGGMQGAGLTDTGGAAGFVSTAGAPGAAGFVNAPSAGGTSSVVLGAGGTAEPPITGSGGNVVVPPPAGAGGMQTSPPPGSGGESSAGGAASGGAAGAPPGSAGSTSIDSSGNLIAPADGDGVQLATTEFILRPGQELFRCFHTEVPIDGEIAVSKFESVMSEGSHHFILYKASADTTPIGTLTNAGCTSGFGGDTWLYTSGSPHSSLTMPENVAMMMSSRQRIIFDMHYINTTASDIHAKVTLNINLAKGDNIIKAGSLVSFNTGIRIPPNGQQTVEGDCTPGAGANFFLMSTHTHKRGTLATITRKLANGQMGEELVRTTDWEHPSALYRPDAPYVTFQPGEKLNYSCSFQNDRASTVTVGTSAELNEMCMAITYFFPASAGGSCGFGGFGF